MPPRNETLVAIATYNEIDSLPRLVGEIVRCLPNCDILVIDDASPDGTAAWVEQRSREDPRMKCLRRAGKLGLGTAVVAGMRYAIEREYRYLINMDADLSHHPRYLQALLDSVAGNDQVDVAVGSRYVPGGGTEGWPFHRRIMSRTLNGFARWWLNLPTRDCSGSYRCYRVAALHQLDLDQVRSRGYSFFEEILFHLRRSGAGMVEVPIVFVDREAGTTKLNLRESVSALVRLLLIRFGL